MFSEINYMKQDSSKNRLALVKTNRVSKFMLSVQTLCCSYYEYKKARVRNVFPSLYQLCLRKMNQYQILKKTKLLQNNKERLEQPLRSSATS